MELPGWGPEDWVKHGSCLAIVCGLECHMCGVAQTMAPMCKSRYPVHCVAVYVKISRTIVDQASTLPKCVRFARMSEKPYEFLCKMFASVPGKIKNELEPILGMKLMGYASGNFSDFGRHKQRGSS